MKACMPPYLGSCLCGQVRFRLNAEPLTLYACHCTDCQRRSGGALLLSMWVQRDALEVLEGTPVLVPSIANDGRERNNKVCPACQIRLWSEPVHRPQLAILRPGMLEQAGSFTPIAHQFVRSALPWFVFPKGVPRYETEPEDPAEYIRLWKASGQHRHGPGEPG
ncbi:GFA family protein [Ramlibacter solisilvae]|uniref:GFA family protein n=1 Tax=Ramlibacter tataouinensis TaxID=94132 RepID=UPI001D10BBFB|nr:GFA family protein [Ramlibacter tataouinensis]